MKLLTSNNKEYEVEWIDGPTFTSGCVILRMRDERRLPEIAADFDGLEWLKRESEEQGNKEFIGYTELRRISRDERGFVLIDLGKEN